MQRYAADVTMASPLYYNFITCDSCAGLLIFISDILLSLSIFGFILRKAATYQSLIPCIATSCCMDGMCCAAF